MKKEIPFHFASKQQEWRRWRDREIGKQRKYSTHEDVQTSCKAIAKNLHKTTSKDLEGCSRGNSEQIEGCSYATRRLKIQKGKGLQRVLEEYSTISEAPFHTNHQTSFFHSSHAHSYRTNTRFNVIGQKGHENPNGDRNDCCNRKSTRKIDYREE